MHTNIYTTVAFGIYLLVMLSIGLYFYFKTKNLSDYVLGGRSLNSWVTSLSAQASGMSGWLFLGLPGFALASGVEAVWMASGLALGTYLNWKLVAKRLRIFTEKLSDAITLPDYFEKRFLDNTRLLRMVSAVFILLFFIFYISSGFVAGAKLFHTVFDISYSTSLLISVGIIISYTFLGGFNAVSWTDFIQGCLMFIAVIVVPTAGYIATPNFHQQILDTNPDLLNLFTKSTGELLPIMGIVSLLGWGLGYLGQPHILARFMAINSPDNIAKALKIAMTWAIISLFGAVMVGIIGIAWLQQPLQDSEAIFMVMVDGLTHPLIAGVLLAGVLAAVMSTADSQLLVASSSLVEDFYKIIFRKNASDKEQVWVSRIGVLIIALIGYFIARNPESSVLDLVAYAWGGLGAAFGPLVLFSLYWRRMTKWGALAGLVTGGMTVLIWKQLSGGIFDVYEIVPGFIFASLAIIFISLVDNPPPKEVETVFDALEIK